MGENGEESAQYEDKKLCYGRGTARRACRYRNYRVI